MSNAKWAAILVCFVLLAISFVSVCVEAPEIHEYGPNTVTVTTGIPTGTINEVALLDTVYYSVAEENVALDSTLTATEEWIVVGSLDSGTFPGDMQTQNDVGVVYLEADDDLGALTGDNILLTPTGAGSYTQWTSQFPAATFHWDKVDDDPPHDANTTYITDSHGYWILDMYEVENIISFPVGTKESGTVTAFSWVLEDATIQSYTNITIRTHGTLYDSVAITLTKEYVNDTWVMGVNLNTYLEWTLAEINAMEVGVAGRRLGVGEIRATSVGAVVPTQALNYVLDVRHNITAVPAGRENYLITMRALTNPGEDITVSVYDHVTLGWDNMFTFTTNAYATEIFALIEADHVNAGEVWIRSVDVAGDAVALDQFDIDLLNVRAWNDPEYTLEFAFNWLGLAPTDQASRLTVVGYRTAVEEMTLEVLRTGVWFTLDAAVLDVAPSASYAYDLAPADTAAGVLQIRFTDNLPADSTQSTIYLDFLSLRLEEEEHGPAAVIDVYVDVSYDLWANEILVEVWWIQTGGPELAVEVGKWVILSVDEHHMGVYNVGEGVLKVDAPWLVWDASDHNITAIGAACIQWEWIQSSQTYYSDPVYEHVANLLRAILICFGAIILSAFIIAIAVRWARGRDDED